MSAYKNKLVAVFRWLFEIPDGYETLSSSAGKGSNSHVNEVATGDSKPAVSNVPKFDTGSYMLSRI